MAQIIWTQVPIDMERARVDQRRAAVREEGAALRPVVPTKSRYTQKSTRIDLLIDWVKARDTVILSLEGRFHEGVLL